MNKQHPTILAFLTLFAALTLAPTAHAKPKTPQFTFPIECALGTDCWAVNYVDTNPATNSAQDHTCGARTYEAHKGTDFALRNHATMQEGVNILAAMDGKIMRFRDSETDTIKAKADLQTITKNNKDCGNGILIDHTTAGFQGLQTMYCHLKKDSVKVEKGQIVKAGQPIAQIGHSGNTEFPHLHFGVFWEGGVIDPFTGALNTDGCTAFKNNLWRAPDKVKYEPIALYDGGFLGNVPDFDKIKRGTDTPPPPSRNANAFLLWVALYGAEKDDEITLNITAPNDSSYAQRTEIQETTRARQFYYTGKKLSPDTPLTLGTYTGIVTVKRKGEPIATKTFTTYIQ